MLDSFAKSRKTPYFVIPRLDRGIQKNKGFWTPAFAGVTTCGAFHETITP